MAMVFLLTAPAMAALLARRGIPGLTLTLLLRSAARTIAAAILAALAVMTLIGSAAILRAAALITVMALAGGVDVGFGLVVGHVALLLLAAIVVIARAHRFSPSGVCFWGL
jgi:hypothetical protein